MKRIIWLIPLLLASCSKDLDPEPNVEGAAPDALNTLPTEVAVIGKKIQNPYSLSVMRRAYENLSPATRGEIAPQDIEATHLYVMFKPSNDKELNSVLMQDGIFWYLYPLDHEVSDGWIELDPRPEFSTNGYQHRWAYVPVGRDLSNIDCPYEILDEIYDPDEDTATRSGVMPTEEFLDAMEVEAHRLCGIDLEPIESTRASKVTPFGKITFWDSTYNQMIGCKGLTVMATRGTKEAYGHCDDNGIFKCNKSFTYNWTYHIYFGRTDFEIRKNNSTNEIHYKISKQHSALIREFGEGTYESFYAAILRAAIVYYYDNIDGLSRPPFKSELKDRMYIKAMLSNSDSYGLYYGVIDRPYIEIFRDNSSGNMRKSSEIYATTTHEIAHAAHWKMDRNGWGSKESVIIESFARGVQWHLTRKLYDGYKVNYYDKGKYTGVIQDLIDNDIYYGISPAIGDKVTGYTIAEIEKALRGCKTWEAWKNNIINQYPYNNTKEYVNEAFDYWNPAN